MRLLYLEDGRIRLTKEYVANPPPYAVLSHTWDSNHENEVVFTDVTNGTPETKPGFHKILFCGKQAISDGLKYFWVDSCCINKSNSTELSEAINSMFRWYKNATRCYVYLAGISSRDISGGPPTCLQLSRSRWFTRGWTLQELIAPPSAEFFTSEGQRIGDRISLEAEISEITKIATPVLRGQPLSQVSIGERKSWASGRMTTRDEDMAYCMMGIFGIYMPPIYGEGKNNALRRLNEKIEKLLNSPDGEREPEDTGSGEDESIVAILSSSIHYPWMDIDKYRFGRAASVAFQHLDRLRDGYLTASALKNFYMETLTQIDFSFSSGRGIYGIASDLANNAGDLIDKVAFTRSLRGLLMSVRRAHEQYLWSQLTDYGYKIQQTSSNQKIQPSWGWQKVVTSERTIYRDVITSKIHSNYTPSAHRQSFSMMRTNALQCSDTLQLLYKYFSEIIPDGSGDDLSSTFDELHRLASNYTIVEDPSYELEVNSLDNAIVNCFICRNLGHDKDRPAFLSNMETLLDSLKPLWLQAAVTCDRLLSLVECLRGIYILLKSKTPPQRYELLRNLWHERDIRCLTKLVLTTAPDWQMLLSSKRRIIAFHHAPTLVKAAEDIAYNFGLHCPMVLEWKTLRVDRKKLKPESHSVFGRLHKPYRSSTLRVRITNSEGCGNEHEITKRWQHGVTYPRGVHTFGIDLTIILQPKSVIYLQLNYDGLVLEEAQIVFQDGFPFIRRDSMHKQFEITQGPFIAWFSMDSAARQVPDWREPLGLCSVFQGIQGHYEKPLQPEWQLRVIPEGQPYYTDPEDDQARHWIRPIPLPPFRRDPIAPDLMPQGWVREWPVERCDSDSPESTGSPRLG